MKWLKVQWKLILFICLASILGLYTCMFAIKKVRNLEIYYKPNLTLKIYSVWHVETFEGGGKARISYLKQVASDIEKSNDGVLFNIQAVDANLLEFKLNGELPDIISFGFGVGKIVLPYLTNLENNYTVRDALVDSGSFANKIYALPYMVGGYAKICHNEENTTSIYGANLYTCPTNHNMLTAYSSQYQAYKEFVNNKNVNLIGTTRDVFRVDNLNKIGRLSASITPIDEYTDLIQYIACTNLNSISELFISNLLSSENQSTLCNYSLFSSLNTKIYTSGIYNAMETAIFKAKIPNVF